MEATTTKGKQWAGEGEAERKRGRGEGKGHPAHIAAIMDALELLSSGRASSKREAAEMVGIHPTSLETSALQIAFATAPEFKTDASVGLLDVVHEGNGNAESVRQSLSRGVVAAAAVLGRVAGRVGVLTKDEKESFKQARDWLNLCRESGLWAQDRNQNLPGELRDASVDHELDLLGVDRWLRDHGRRDGIGETARRVLTERQSLKSPLPVDQGEGDQHER